MGADADRLATVSRRDAKVATDGQRPADVAGAAGALSGRKAVEVTVRPFSAHRCVCGNRGEAGSRRGFDLEMQLSRPDAAPDHEPDLSRISEAGVRQAVRREVLGVWRRLETGGHRRGGNEPGINEQCQRRHEATRQPRPPRCLGACAHPRLPRPRNLKAARTLQL